MLKAQEQMVPGCDMRARVEGNTACNMLNISTDHPTILNPILLSVQPFAELPKRSTFGNRAHHGRQSVRSTPLRAISTLNPREALSTTLDDAKDRAEPWVPSIAASPLVLGQRPYQTGKAVRARRLRLVWDLNMRLTQLTPMTHRITSSLGFAIVAACKQTMYCCVAVVSQAGTAEEAEGSGAGGAWLRHARVHGAA